MVKKQLGICIGYFRSMEMRGSHTIMNNYNNILVKVFPGGSDGKTSVYNVRDLGSISGLGRFSGEGNGNPLQYSSLENPMDRGAWCRLLSMGSQRVGHD